jgi:outer membrane receptor for ferrienterochelin and colicins
MAACAAVILILFSQALMQANAQEKAKDITEIPLEDLSKVEVFSASKFSQKVSEAPASITIITATDIQHYGYRTFDEILRSVTGFFVTYDRNYAYVGTRGFGLPGDYNSRILILIDGHRLNDNIYGSTGIGTDFPVVLDLIERVEIVRGPGSSLYGTNAFFAVANVITKRGRAFDGMHLWAEAGSLQTYKGTAAFGRKFNNGLEVLVSGSYMDSKGHQTLYFPEFDSPENNNGLAENADTDRSDNILASLSFGDFSAQMLYGSRTKRIPTASYGTAFNDRRSLTTDTRSYLDLKYNHIFKNTWKLLARTSVDTYDDDGSYSYIYSTNELPQQVINRDISSGRWWGGEVQLTRTIVGRHHLTAGSEWRYGFRGDQRNYDEPGDLYLDSRIQTTESGTYLQGELGILKNLLLSAGIRHDRYSTFGGATSPRLGLVYSPWKRTTTKVLYGNAFRAPNLYEMFYQDNASIKENRELKPEKIHTLEFVIEQYLGSNFRLSGEAYQYRVQHQLVQGMDSTDGLLIFKNAGSVHARGIEVEFEGKNSRGIEGHISYTFQKTKDLTSGVSMPNSPRHIAQLNLFVPWLGLKGGTGLEMRYMSSRQTLQNQNVGGFLLANLTIIYKKLLPNMDLSAGINNIFDKRYSDPSSTGMIEDSLIQNSRAFYTKLGYRFEAK